MTRLAALLIAVTPTLALADKDFGGGSGATYDCSEDPIVNVNHDSGTYTFTGACKEIHLNGSDLHVRIESTDSVAVNGGGTVVKVLEVDEILVNGRNNNVRWTRGKSVRRPSIAVNGVGNSIARGK